MARPDFKRTKHPIHSFSVWGKYRDKLCAMDNKSSFGLDSPFHFLYESAAQMLIIGIGFQGAFTFAHYVEEREKAFYRYFKILPGRTRTRAARPLEKRIRCSFALRSAASSPFSIRWAKYWKKKA
jgi:aminoglycoside N3'-acetyltransferase